MESYVSNDAGSIKTSPSAKITGGNEVCRDTVKGLCDTVFHKEMPAEAINEVNRRFGNVYSENPEGYAVIISDRADVYSLSDIGLLFGAYALLRRNKSGEIKKGAVYSYPRIAIRGVKVFLPSRENIPFFKEFVKFASFYGCNSIMIETGGALEYKKHPEINEGWEEYCRIFNEYQGKTIDVQKSFGWMKNSIHFENGGGSWLTQEEVSKLVDFCRKYYMDVVPEIPTLSHSDYLLTRHPELAERAEDPLPNTYCPSNPETYKLIFDIFDETIEVFRPITVNIGHDEYYDICLCEKCRKKDAADIYADDVNKIYKYFKDRGIGVAMWGDKLLNVITKAGYHYGGSQIEYDTADGRHYTVPATYKSIEKIPKDITIVNWYWRIDRKLDKVYFENGLENVLYGNFKPMQIYDCRERMDGKISGYYISNWSSLDPAHIQRNGIFAGIAYAAAMFWKPDFCENEFESNFINMSNDIFCYNYNIANPGNYACVVHTTSETRPHKEFVDGYLMDYDGDYLGEYTVYYTDGTTDTQKLWFGLNIGNCDVKIGTKPWYDSDCYELLPYFYEPGFTCAYVPADEKMYYRYMLKVDGSKQVKDIKLTDGNVEVREIKYDNRDFT